MQELEEDKIMAKCQHQMVPHYAIEAWAQMSLVITVTTVLS